ncbi:hypothetical protein DUI87_08458 [Hirundo rustica rustica]|uniref:Doublecortin domain-containing protein 2 n=1 Tax=Hirundo rustica rustica TaxID=333673 RepID=A0A3M0KSW0_HIRRU|nr:hypothetical protein DUI87_08458 [Hirundo rustica rustica]
MTSPGTKASWLSQPAVKSVLVYRNGDPFFPGRRIVIHEKKVSNFDVFLKEVTGGVQAPFGAVRNIYTPRGGHRVRQLDELQSGEQYVAGGREAFKKLNYLDIGETKKKPAEVNNEVKPVTHSRITVSARFRKPLQEPYTIFLIANGDLISPAVRLLIPRKTLDHWDHILEMVTGKVTLRSGAVHRLYTVDGKLVQNGLDLENGQIYVAVGREKFKKLPYGDLLSKSTTRRPQGSKTSVQPPVVGSRRSKGNGNDGQSKSTTGSSDQGENNSSPQLPKRKDKKSQNPENSVSRQHFSNHYTKVKQTVKASTGVLQGSSSPFYLNCCPRMVANALWGWLEKWKKANWQRRGKPIWAADEWKDIATRVEKLPVKVRHVDAHVPKSRANEEHRNNEQVDQAAKIEVSKIDLDWQHKGELFLARWAHDASGHQGRYATYKWAQDRGVDLTMDSISQVIHDCETCSAIKQAKRVKPLWYGGRWSKYKYGEAWQIDYITLPQTRQGKRYVLTMVEATTGWLETYPVPHATARNTILGLEKQFFGGMVPLRGLSQTMELISRTASSTTGLGNTALSGCTISPIMHQLQGK